MQRGIFIENQLFGRIPEKPNYFVSLDVHRDILCVGSVTLLKTESGLKAPPRIWVEVTC
jgi:hypothetical protein